MSQSIYEEIGGEPAVSAAVDLFYERVWADRDLSRYFDGTDREKLKGHQRAFISTALGGPAADQGRPLSEAHAGLGITDHAFDQVVAHLAGALTEFDVPAPTIEEIAAALAPLRGDVVESPGVETG
jgi:hemoglobin